MTEINTKDFTAKAKALLKFGDKDVDYLIWQGDKLAISTRQVSAYVDFIDIGAGKLVIPAKAIELINKIDTETCEIGFEEGQLIIKYRRASTKFNMPENFYEAKIFDGEVPKLNVIENDIIDNIKKVARYCSINETAKAQNGVYFKGNGKQLEIVGVDGYRLMVFTTSACKAKIDLVIAKEFIEKIVNLAAAEVEDIKCCEIENAKALFVIGEYTLIVPTLAFEKFIDYKTIIKTHKGSIVTVNPIELRYAIERVSISCGKDNAVILKTENNELIVKTGSDRSKGKEAVSTQKVEKDIIRQFRSSWLIDMLSNFSADIDMIFGEFNTQGVSVLVEDTEKKQSLFTFILPMRMRGAN